MPGPARMVAAALLCGALLLSVSGCTPEKARAVQAAAVQFRIEALAAVDALRAFEEAEIAAPERASAAVIDQAVDSLLAVTLEQHETDPFLVETVLDPYTSERSAETRAAWDGYLALLRQQYSALSDIYRRLDQGSLAGREAVRRSVEPARKLTAQLARIAESLKGHPPILIQRRSAALASVDALRARYQALPRPAASEPPALREDREAIHRDLGRALADWQQVRADEKELQRATVEQCLGAAVLGKQLTGLLESYDKVDLAVLGASIPRILESAAALSGRDFGYLNERSAALLAEMEQDSTWKATSEWALREINRKLDRDRQVSGPGPARGSDD